jgi:hypothetical protein
LCDHLKLPPKNEFIPTDFDLMPREETVSIVIVILQYCNSYVLFSEGSIEDGFLLQISTNDN